VWALHKSIVCLCVCEHACGLTGKMSGAQERLTHFDIGCDGALHVCGLSIPDALARRPEAAGKPPPSAPP
jgi:hypothetical protein